MSDQPHIPGEKCPLCTEQEAGPKSMCGHFTEKKNSLVLAKHHPHIKVAQTLQVNLHNNLQKSASAGKMLQKDCAVLSKRISDLIIYT